MKKISSFLAVLLFVMSFATSFGNVQEVNAFSQSEINSSDYNWYRSSKAGTSVYFNYSIDYETADSFDVTGWKAALCPENNVSLSAAALVVDVTNANKTVNDKYSYADVSVAGVLAKDIPEGYYKQAFFDASGKLVYESFWSDLYINKVLVTFSCVTMNNDGFAYAYVYSENPAVNASTYPTFYGADRKTAVTSFNDYTTIKTEYGDTVHYYKLNILDKSQFVLDQEGFVPMTCLYYKVGTPNVVLPPLTVSGGDVSGNNPGTDKKNDGGIGANSSDAAGFAYTNVFNLNEYVVKVNETNPELNWTVVNPFDNKDSEGSGSGSNSGSNSGSSTSGSGFATVGGQSVAVTVTALGSSSDQKVQASIDKLKEWTAAGKNVANILNSYAPAMKVKSVVASGTLDMTIGVDISAGVPITFTDSAIKANVKTGDNIIVLHVKHDGTIEYLPAVAGDGTITATFNSLSPVAWFKVNVGDGSEGVAPKTGESFWNYLLSLFF